MRPHFLALALLIALPGTAVGADPAFVEQDTTGVYKALRGMAYRRLVEINIAALGTREVSYSENDQAYLGQALACVADPRGGDIRPVDLLEDVSARFGPVCSAQGGTAITAPYEAGSARAGIATDISWATWANPNKPAEGAWGGELYCGVDQTPLFKVRAVSALRRIGCVGRSAIELIVPKDPSPTMQSEWQQAVRYDLARREQAARLEEGQRERAERAAKAVEENRARGHAAMATVERGTKICSDTILGRGEVLYGYVEEVVGERVKVLISGRSSRSYVTGSGPQAQDMHWYGLSEWRVCD